MAKYELIPNQDQEAEAKHETKSCAAAAVGKNVGDPPSAESIGWTADGMPVSDPMVQRSQWETGLFSCLGKNDEFYGSDLEVSIRRRFNLEGSCEAVTGSCGCCGDHLMDEIQREQCESSCDLGTHIFCHACALCQEAREVRRRLPHPGLARQPVLVMLPPDGQTIMGYGA